MRKKILALGHPRGATGYTAALLRCFGLNVGHECMKEDGIVHWKYAAHIPPDYEFDFVLHVIRHPYNTIESMVKSTHKDSKRFLLETAGIGTEYPELTAHCKAYLEWHRMIDELQPDYTINAEKKGHAFALFGTLYFRDITSSMVDIIPATSTNSRSYDKLMPEDWRIVPGCVIDELCEFCDAYGYDIPEMWKD